MRKILVIAKKELLRAFRDPTTLYIIFIVPLIQLFILGYTIVLDVKNISLTIVDLDNSPLTHEIIEHFQASKLFKIKEITNNPFKSVQNIKNGTTLISITFPKDFSNIESGSYKSSIQIIVDGVDTNTANVAIGYINGIIDNLINAFKRKISLANPIVTFPKIDIKFSYLFNKELNNKFFMIPGIIVVLITMVSSILTSMSLVREKEEGTWEQIIVSPIKSYHLIIGKVLPFAMLTFIEFVLAILVALFHYKVPLRGSILLLFCVSFIYLLNSLGLGIFISTIVKTRMQSIFLGWFFNIFAILMSGFFIPIRNMPIILQYLTYINPVRYFMEIIRGIFLKANNLYEIYPKIIIISVFSISMFVLSSLFFSKKLD